MTELSNSDNVSTPQSPELDVLTLLKRMQQQLTFLEQKVDILIKQSQDKPARERSFSKPYSSPERSYRPPSYQDKRGPRDNSRERSPYSGGYFDKREGGEGRKFSGPKKNYNDRRESSYSQDAPFKKKYGGEKRGFDPKKKPFFNKRKD